MRLSRRVQDRCVAVSRLRDGKGCLVVLGRAPGQTANVIARGRLVHGSVRGPACVPVQVQVQAMRGSSAACDALRQWRAGVL